MRPYKICCLTYKTLDALVKQALSQYRDPEIDVSILETALMEDAGIPGELQELEKSGCEVIIGGGSNANIARERCGIPVIEYRLTVYDYMEAIDRAFILGERAAFCTYRHPLDPALLKYLGKARIPFTNIIYDGEEDLREQMLAHRGEVIIGPAFSVDLAMQMGFNYVSIYPGEEAVLVAIRDAKMLAGQLRRQNEYHQFAQAVIDYSTNGLALVNSNGAIIDFNAAAEDIWSAKAEAVKGKKAEDMFADSGYSQFWREGRAEQTDVRKIMGKPILCKWIQLMEKSQAVIGAVGIFSKMSDILEKQYAYQQKQKEESVKRGFAAKKRFGDMIGSSVLFKRVKAEAMLFARGGANVMLLGETGVGKEIFAQSIHNESSRKNGPFIAVNCAALPESLLESELFGYDEGAFTGSKRGGKKGLFELADGGTLFLDEIGELSPALQGRLLRALQEHEIMHVGGDRVIPVDVRVISASNRSLDNREEAGPASFAVSPAEQGKTFRGDLYYRLSVFELHIPPVRERGNDAVELFEDFLKQKGNFRLAFENVSFRKLPGDFKMIITEYPWFGNIRELQNVGERFLLYAKASLPGNTSAPGAAQIKDTYLKQSIVRAIGEQRLLKALLDKYDFSRKEPDAKLIALLQRTFGLTKAGVAEKLGLSRTTLWRKSKG
jgi:propionate catabolism operon transcriptional regulator